VIRDKILIYEWANPPKNKIIEKCMLIVYNSINKLESLCKLDRL